MTPAAAILLLALALPAAAAAQASLEGRVVQAGGAALPGAHVELRTPNRLVAETSAAAPDGSFRLGPLEPGAYRLSVSALGYFTATYDVALRPRQALLLTVELTPAQRATERVEVHAATSELGLGQTGTSQFLTRARLEALPAPLTRDVPALALALFPGASLSHDNFVHVRGNEVSLHEFINGVGFLDNPQQEFGPGLNPMMFESVNLITGWFPAEFGNRFGGVLDSTARSGFDAQGHGTLAAGAGTVAHNDLAADYGAARGRWGYYLFAGGFTSDWYLNPPQPHQFHDFGAGVRAATQIDYRGPRDTVQLFLLGAGTNFDLPNSTENQEAGRNATRRLRSQTAILGWQHVFSPRALLHTSFYERTLGDRLRPTADLETEFGDGSRSDLMAGVKSDFTYARGRHVWKLGTDVTRLHLAESFVYDGRHRLPLEPEELAPFSFRGGARGFETSLYAQDHFTLLRDLTLDLGVRYDRFDLIGVYTQVSPRAGLSYHLARTRSVVHFAYNRLFSPYPIEYAALASYLGTTAAEPDQRVGPIKPYRQNYYELGWNQELHPKVFLEVNAFTHHGTTPFEYREIGAAQLFLPINAARAESEGVEVSLLLRQLERWGVSGRFSYAAQRTRFFGPFAGGFAHGEEKDPGEEFLPAFDETHTGTASFFYRPHWRDFWTGVLFFYGSGTAAKDGALRLPQHLTADYVLGLTLWERELQRLEFEFNVTNLADNRFRVAKESEETSVQFAPPQTVSGRLRWRF